LVPHFEDCSPCVTLNCKFIFWELHGTFLELIRSSPAVAQYATALQKYFLHPSLVIYFFGTPPIKLKLRQQIGGGITNSKPLGPIIMICQSETLSTSQIVFIKLFSAGADICCTFYKPTETLAKTIFLSQTDMF
jgi:hypothetical protein